MGFGLTNPSLQESVVTLHRLRTDLRQIGPMVDEMLARLVEALDALRGVEHLHARNAEAEIRAAQAALQEALAVWLESYARGSEDLSRRIVS